MLDIWSKVKESSEKSGRETAKLLGELHSKLPLRADCPTEPKIEDIQNEVS